MLAAALLGQLLVLSAAVGTATSLPTARRLGNETSADSGSMNLRRDKTDACIPPGALALGAQQICSGAPVGAALLSVRVHGHEIAEWALAALGFREVMDLQLLAGTPEAEELMDELKLSAGLSIPDRAKLRLLIGAGAKDQAHLADHTAAANADGPLGRTPAGDSHGPNAGLPRTVLRTLQEERTDGGVSADTIAIVMSVLVGAAGYLVQAYTARRAEQSATELAQEQHLSEQTRRREHEQMLAQIGRTDRWVDEFCRPLAMLLTSVHFVRKAHLYDALFEIESSHPEVVADMVSLAAPIVAIGEDGVARSTRSGNVHWDPAIAKRAQLTKADGSDYHGAPSAASTAITNADSIYQLQSPLVDVLPRGLLEVIKAEPTGPVAARYRQYIRTCYHPLLQQVSNLLGAGCASTVGWPEAEWLCGSSTLCCACLRADDFAVILPCAATCRAEHFPLMVSGTNTGGTFANIWVAHQMSFEAVIACWEEGSMAATGSSYLLPWLGLTKANNWSTSRAEQKQQELIGMTAAKDIDMSLFVSYADTTAPIAAQTV